MTTPLLQHWLLEATSQLEGTYEEEEARLIPRMVAEHLMGVDRMGLKSQELAPIPSASIDLFTSALSRLRAGEPVQYVLGVTHFYGRDFEVNPHVLIPRQETEELVVGVRNELLKLLRPSRLVDIGSGSGCIPVSLYLELAAKGLTPEAVSGLDISSAALNLARRNGDRLGASVNWLEQDIFQAKEADFEELDAVVSNPPYIPGREKAEMSPVVYAHEPAVALFVPDDDAIIFYKQIVHLAAHWLRSEGLLWVEIHRDFGKEVAAVFKAKGFTDVQIITDLSGNPRFVRGICP